MKVKTTCLPRVNKPGRTTITIAKDIRFMQHLASIPTLSLYLPSIDKVGMRPLHWAATEGSNPLVALILSHLDAPSDNSTNNSHSHAMNARYPSVCYYFISMVFETIWINVIVLDNHSTTSFGEIEREYRCGGLSIGSSGSICRTDE